MPATFGSDSVTPYATRTNTPITAPSGIADGDKLVIKLLIGGFGAIPAVTPPGGFTEVTGSPYPLSVESGGFTLQAHLYWKDADGESGDYTLLHASANTNAWMGRIVGAAPGPPTVTGATSAGLTPTAPSITPAGDGAFFAFWASSFNFLGAVTQPAAPPTFTERLDSGASILYVATGEMGAAEPSGDKSVTITEAPSMAGLIVIEAAEEEPEPEPQTLRPRRYMTKPQTTAIDVPVAKITNSPFKSDIIRIDDASRVTLMVQTDIPATTGQWLVKAVPLENPAVEGQVIATLNFPATPAVVASVTVEVAQMFVYVQQQAALNGGVAMQRMVLLKQ